jgi:Transglycosylase
MAARGYFGKPTRQLTVAEGALLAGLTKGATYFSPIAAPPSPENGSPMCSTACGKTACSTPRCATKTPVQDRHRCRRWCP